MQRAPRRDWMHAPRAAASHFAISPSVGAAVVIGACWLLAVTPIGAAEPEGALAVASQAFQDGDYRLAAAKLNELAGGRDQIPPAQRLKYWNLCVDVALESGLVDVAENAARTHLELVQQAKAAGGRGQNAAEQLALARMARIERLYANADAGSGRGGTEAAAHWTKARELLTAALAIPAGARDVDPLWEAQTRLELARMLEKLDQQEAARGEFTAADALAKAGIQKLAAADEPLDELLRGIAIVQSAHSRRDDDAARRQAEAALAILAKPLQQSELTAVDRVNLRVAAASCRRQLHDAEAETQLLTDALQAAGDDPQVAPTVRAEIMVRLAELADSGDDATQRARAKALYESAARLYRAGLANATTEATATTTTQDKKSPQLTRGQAAECLLQLQLINVRLEAWDEAIRAAEELLALRQKALLSSRDPNYFRAKSAVGSLYAKSARSALARNAGEAPDFSAARQAASQARTHLQSALEFWQAHRPLARRELAATLNYYAEALRYNGEFRRANELLEQAEPHFAAAYDVSALIVGEFQSNRGAVLAALGLYQPALDSYEAAGNVAKSRGGGDDARSRGQLLGFVYLNLAQLYKSQGQFAEARQMSKLASSEAEKWLTGADRAPFQIVDAALSIAEAEYLYPRIARNGKTQEEKTAEVRQDTQAQELLRDAIRIADSIVQQSAGSVDPLTADVARHVDALAIYRLCALYAPRDVSLDTAKALWAEVADESTSRDDLQSDILRVRALNALAMIALREAAESRAQARAVEAQGETAVNAPLDASEKSLQEADRRSMQAQQIAQDMPAYPATRFQALFTRAQVLKAQAQIEQAAAKRLDQETRTALARQASDRADIATSGAIDALKDALSMIELPRAMTTGAEEQRAAYFSQFSPGFDLLVDLLVEQDRLREAVEVSEQRRSRTFLDQLRVAGVDLHETVPPAHQHLVAEAQRARDDYYTYLAKWLADRSAGINDAGAVVELNTLQRRLVAAEEKVRAASSVYRQLLVKPLATEVAAAATISDSDWVAQRIGTGDVALVYYIGSEKSYVFECSAKHGIRGQMLTVSSDQAARLGLPSRANPNDGPATASRPLRANDVARLVQRVASDISQLPGELNRSPSAAAQRGARGQRLVAVTATKIDPTDLWRVTDVLMPSPLRERVNEKEFSHVLIVPDGALHQLAFEALPFDIARTRFVLDSFPPMCYAPSLQIYRQLTEPSIAAAGGQMTLLSVADPAYRETNAADSPSSAEEPSMEQEFFYCLRGALQRLPSTRRESDQLRLAFEALQPRRVGVIQLTDNDATEANLKQTLADLAARDVPVSFLHVAAHGLVDQQYNNLFGALALAPPDRPTATDDGFLSLYEVMMLPLGGCQLAVLSACETNCGPENALEAGSTMARAFFCAGAHRVVSSHWKVSDDATAELIASFMNQIKDDMAAGKTADYAAALQQAKRKVLKPDATSATVSPYFWAPFVLIGPPTGSGLDDHNGTVTASRE